MKSEEGRGTSVVDKEGIFGYKNWEYVVIPKGTVIPSEIIITKDHYISRKKCWHYSISPNYDMPINKFLAALDRLAINAGIGLGGTKMPEIDVRSLSVCIQALQHAIKYNDFLSQSQTVDSDDFEESSYMYEVELSRLIKIYSEAEKAGNTSIPLSMLLKPPFDDLLNLG